MTRYQILQLQIVSISDLGINYLISKLIILSIQTYSFLFKNVFTVVFDIYTKCKKFFENNNLLIKTAVIRFVSLKIFSKTSWDWKFSQAELYADQVFFVWN